MAQIDLTIVVPALNEEANIWRCLKSVFAAIDGLETEIILVDSGSKDRTVEIASEFPIKIFKFREHWPKSCGAGIYTGILKSSSSSRYIQYVEADTEIDKHWFKQAIAYLEAHPDVAAVAGQWKHIGQSGGAVDSVQSDLDEVTKSNERVTGGPFLFHADLLRENNYNPYLPGGVDIDLMLRLASKGYKAVRIPRPMLLHYDHPISAGAHLRKVFKRYGRGLGIGIRYALHDTQVMKAYLNLRSFKKGLLVLTWLIAIPVSALFWIAAGISGFLWAVLTIGLLSWIWLVVKFGSFKEGTFRRLRSIAWALGFICGIGSGMPKKPNSFPDDPIPLKR